jgi:hypothetical protein
MDQAGKSFDNASFSILRYMVLPISETAERGIFKVTKR